MFKYFRVFKKKSALMSAYDVEEVSGEWKTRKGTLWDIEFWLYKISFNLSFVYWSETE